jgi:hypothetical protein
VCAFAFGAASVLDDQVIGFVVFNVELEHQIQALCCVSIEILFQFVEYLSYGHVFTLLYVCIGVFGADFGIRL